MVRYVFGRRGLSCFVDTLKMIALLTACEAPQWKEKAGFILPPPQGVAAGQAYELTLLPFAGTEGRIAAFPTAYAGDREA